MPFVKAIKSKAYFRRYQVKFRRRREGKTDYRARKRLINQDKNKYNSPRFRLVVRFSNKYVTVQVASAHIEGDRILTTASSSELPRYGLKVGLKNYAASYCTGLLCARRLLKKLGLDETYEGQAGDDVTGEVVKTEMNGRTYFVGEVDDEKRPFRTLLDVGIVATTTGHRAFGALKGATDGGLDVPHSEKRFPGYDRDAKKYEAETHRDRIMGAHVSEYMEYLQEEDETAFKERFSRYIEEGVEADGVEEMFQGVHEKIREDPSPAAKKEYTPDKKYKKPVKLSRDDRKARAAEKKASIRQAMEE